MKMLFVFLFFSLASSACSQNQKSNDLGKFEKEKVCDTIMGLFVAGKIRPALDILRQHTVIAPASIDSLEVTINYQVSNYFPAYGKILGYEFVHEKCVKDFVCKRSYILKFEKYYLKFDFVLYKASTNWTITNFKYDENLTGVLY